MIDLPDKHRPPTARGLGLRGSPPLAHHSPPRRPLQKKEVEVTAALTGRRNSRCSCAISRRYLFTGPGSAIASARGAPAPPRVSHSFLPLPTASAKAEPEEPEAEVGRVGSLRRFPACGIWAPQFQERFLLLPGAFCLRSRCTRSWCEKMCCVQEQVAMRLCSSQWSINTLSLS